MPVSAINKKNKLLDFSYSDPSPFVNSDYDTMAKVMGSKNPLNTTNTPVDDLYGVTPAAYQKGKGTILPVHMAVRARYSMNISHY